MGFFILIGCTAISVGFWKYWYDLFNIQEKKIKNLQIEIPPSYEQTGHIPNGILYNGNINNGNINNGNINNDNDDQPLIGLPPCYYSTTTN
jgi:hypothetical protein